MKIKVLLFAGLVCCLTAWAETPATGFVIPPKARIAICGDSISAVLTYTRVVEIYLLACAGRSDVSTFNFGIGGTTTFDLAYHGEERLRFYNPTMVMFLYGGNDGLWRPWEDGTGVAFEKYTRLILANLAAMDIKTVMIASTVACDTKTSKVASFYNPVLRRLGEIDRKLAAEYKLPFADVHSMYCETMVKSKAALGDDYDLAHDGAHPNVNGGLCIAYVLLKTMGCDGKIADITVDLHGPGSASEGHRIINSANGRVELESTRYPLVYDADPKSPDSTRSILTFVPFSQDLNRFILKVKNLSSAKATVTWGTETKEFTRAQLENGINLVAEFEKTPFDTAFRNVMQKVLDKQKFEAVIIQKGVGQFKWMRERFKDNPEIQGTLDLLSKRLMSAWEQKDRSMRDAVVPVKHALVVTPIP